MWTRQHKKRGFGRWIIPTMTAAVLCYFGYHAYHGSYGIYSKHELDKRIASLQAELKDRTQERMEIEQRVSLLRDGSIEQDMLDEYARRELDFSRPNDMIIMTGRASHN